MIKAVLSSSGANPSLNTAPNLTFKSNTLEGSDSKTYETRISQSRPFFKDPYAEKLSGLEQTLHAIMTGKMNDEQKLILYKNSLNDIFVTDRMRKLNAHKPEGQERAAPPARVPQPEAVAALPTQAPPHPPAPLGEEIPKKKKKKKKMKTHRAGDLGRVLKRYKDDVTRKIARRYRKLRGEEAPGGEPPPSRSRLLPSPPVRRPNKRKPTDYPDYPPVARRTRSQV